MRTSTSILASLAAAALLAGCSEKPQDHAGIRSDKPAEAGTGVAAFTQPGWTVGDKASWSNQLKARASYGMNDHLRAPK